MIYRPLLALFRSTLVRTTLKYTLTRNMAALRPKEEDSLLKGVVVSRVMLPDDANNAGNVHGGVILKLMEEAGVVIATRYCNRQAVSSKANPVIAALARVESMDFLLPMHIGEVAEVMAEIRYTASHSLEVIVDVWAEDILHGTKRFTNKATLWYVPFNVETNSVAAVPPMEYESPEIEERGRLAYERQKLERSKTTPSLMSPHPICDNQQQGFWPEQHTVQYSQTTLTHLIMPSDCAVHGYAMGGVIMKLMDECAGVVSAKHCHSNVVTASIDTINFHGKAKKGSLLTVIGRATFTSSRTVEVEVNVDVETIQTFASQTKERAVHAYFNFVSLDKQRKTLQVPPLKVKSPGELQRWEEGKERYEVKKRSRLKAKEEERKKKEELETSMLTPLMSNM
ncbi:cytosolic acyl coenzyme A thioester hydrolase-like [Lineus longissimus]|uniref:cytosolic acyl coenzyme A thioester hydrolase-like n=1 Tax=Lineus longissimus TaxID=88925 RepID=UPI002B4E86CC